MLLAFDPGKRLSGAALFERPGGPLVDAALIRGEESGEASGVVWLAMIDALRQWIGARPVTWVAVEQMVIRPSMIVAAPALMHLQAITGAVLGVYGRPGACCALAPEAWKGQLPKRQHHSRLLTKMSQRELDVLSGLFDLQGYIGALAGEGELPEAHNLLDAVGLGSSRAVQFELLGDVRARQVATSHSGAIKKTTNGTSFLHWTR